ncbi:MAG: hypothetical protein HZA25_01570 [Candidatus Niyogibacteria bacterium]|nr:hypothetical protein [Candidatus Niyogibacteria bacterium]
MIGLLTRSDFLGTAVSSKYNSSASWSIARASFLLLPKLETSTSKHWAI